jgi:hypothetical protein
MIWIKSDPGLNFPYNKSVRHLIYESVFLKTSEEQNFQKNNEAQSHIHLLSPFVTILLPHQRPTCR